MFSTAFDRLKTAYYQNSQKVLLTATYAAILTATYYYGKSNGKLELRFFLKEKNS
jgi:hypothetical protein